MTTIRKLIRADGAEEDLIGPHAIGDIEQLIGADVLDTVAMRHLGNPLHIMLVDDMGHSKELPVNQKATELYLKNCRPNTFHKIRGDVVIVPDGDYARA